MATIVFIRALDVDSFAYLVLFLNIGQFAGSALTGGVRMRYMRAEAERVSRGEGRATGFGLAMGATLVLVLGVATMAFAAVLLLDSNGSSSHLLFVPLTAAYTAGNAAIELAMYHYQAHLRFSRAGIVGVIRGAATIAVAGIAGFHLLGSGVAAAAATAGATLAVALIVCLPLILQTASRSMSEVLGDDFGRESGWLTVYYLASAGFAYADIFVVASFLDANAVASYGAALRYLAIVLGPMPALLAVLRVRTSQHDVVDSSHLQTRMLMDWIRRTIVPVSLTIGVVAVAAPFLIPLLDGGRYPDSIPVFQVMLLPAIVNYATMPAPNLLMTQKRYRLLACFYAVVLVVQLIVASGMAQLAGVVAVAAVASSVGAAEAGGLAYLALRFSRQGASTPEAAT